MLVAFAFSNFKSFVGEAELSFLAYRPEKSIPGALIDPKVPSLAQDQILPVLAIYGSNAAGKSNVILALQYMASAVRESHIGWLPGSGTNVDAHALHKDEGSKFEITFVSSGRLYKYGFEAQLGYFSREWLTEQIVGRPRKLYERSTTKAEQVYETSIKFGAHFEGGKRFQSLIQQRVRENSLVLSVASQENSSVARAVFNFFAGGMAIVTPTMTERSTFRILTTKICAESPDIKDLALKLIRAADRNIVDFEIINSEERIVDAEMPDYIDDMSLRKFYDEAVKTDVRFVFESEGQKFSLPYSAQSRGVQRIFNLLSAVILSLRMGRVIVIDELEVSLHAHLASQLVAIYQSKSTNKSGAQLLMTTHETRLLGRDEMRRDQIWFVQRTEGKSELYPLIDFSPRKDENIEMAYLRGKYGAVPDTSLSPDWFSALHNEAAQ